MNEVGGVPPLIMSLKTKWKCVVRPTRGLIYLESRF